MKANSKQRRSSGLTINMIKISHDSLFGSMISKVVLAQGMIPTHPTVERPDL